MATEPEQHLCTLRAHGRQTDRSRRIGR
jgi:hypothetical protein